MQPPSNSNSDPFTGSKLAYIFNNELLVYKRNDIPTIPFPNLWDFPGGARDGSESPEECALRELFEEFGIHIDASRFVYKRRVVNFDHTGYAYFFVVEGKQAEIDNIQFGDEGQYWQMMQIEDYLSHTDAVPSLVQRLADYLAKKRKNENKN